MTPKRFRSKVDAWIAVLLAVAIVGMLFAFIAVMINEPSVKLRLVVGAMTVLGLALMLSVMLRTHYTVGNGEVRIVSGPFSWTIPIADITDIKETRNPLSSPAMSLDRLKISYGRRKWVMVSPADKKKFIQAIEQQK